MRGDDRQQPDLFLYGTLEQRVPDDHPLRPVRAMTDAALEALSPRFDALYAAKGRPSIAPEKLLRALLLQALYSIRSERMLVEQIEYNLLFRWFVGLGMNDSAWNHAVFSKNRERLLGGEIAAEFFSCVVDQARALGLLSDEHFTVDGTLIQAWASHKSFRPKTARTKTARADFGARREATKRIARPPIRSLGCIARAAGRKRSWPIWGMRSSRTGTAWQWM